MWERLQIGGFKSCRVDVRGFSWCYCKAVCFKQIVLFNFVPVLLLLKRIYQEINSLAF